MWWLAASLFHTSPSEREGGKSSQVKSSHEVTLDFLWEKPGAYTGLTPIPDSL